MNFGVWATSYAGSAPASSFELPDVKTAVIILLAGCILYNWRVCTAPLQRLFNWLRGNTIAIEAASTSNKADARRYIERAIDINVPANASGADLICIGMTRPQVEEESRLNPRFRQHLKETHAGRL
jgi:hypothetical protein